MRVTGASELGNVVVMATNNRGASVEEIAARALDKIISVGNESHPLLRDQAVAYKEQIRSVLEYYMAEAIKAEHTNIRNRLRETGCAEITPLALGE
jgi:hypothetical protein